MSACPDCQGTRLCAEHAWMRDAMIRVAGSERAEAFLRSLGAHPSREAQEGTEGVSEAPSHPKPGDDDVSINYTYSLNAYGDAEINLAMYGHDSAITGATSCPHCAQGLIWFHGMLVCAGCDGMDLWPALEGEGFYDQDGGQDA